MQSWHYLLIAIILIVALILIFFISYYLNKKTPVPKGCENLLVDEENCKSCKVSDCELRKELKNKQEDKNSSISKKEDD